MIIKYKSCCDQKCLLGRCNIRDNGGCYCACRLKDLIEHLKSVIDGFTIIHGIGSIYIPDEKRREECINKMSIENREKYLRFKNEEAPELHMKAYKKFQEEYIES
jgi:hypothetical protein